MKPRGLACLLLAGVAAAVVGLVGAAPASAEDTFLPIQNFGSYKCLQPENGSLELGAAIVQEPCDPNNPAQLWEAIPLGGFSFHYMNQASQLCLDARGGATNGTPIQQWTCNWISNEKWQPGSSFPGVAHALTSQVSGTSSHCLDEPGAQGSDGLAMQLYSCNLTVAQVWWSDD